MIGKRLRYLREKENLSQLALSKKLKIPNQSLSNYERDFRSPDYETLEKLASFFDVTTDYLLGRSDRPRLTEEKDKEFNDLKAIIDSMDDNRREETKRRILAYAKGLADADKD